jgi:hypothetical protein
VLIAAWAATAAKPHKGARYFGFEGSETVMGYTDQTAKARVSGSGRRFRRGSYVDLTFFCSRNDPSYFIRRVRLAGVRISRGGRFSKVKRHGSVHYRLSGRFVMRNYARAYYRASSTPEHPRNRAHPGRCKTGRTKVALYERGVPPFSGCRSQRAKTDLRNDGGRVFEQLLGIGGGVFLPHVYACLFSTNKRILLGRNWDDEMIEQPRLAEPYVAYLNTGSMSRSAAITVRDLRDGHVLRDRLQPSLESSDYYTQRVRLVTSLVLKANGSVAWIVDRQAFADQPRTLDVVAVDSAGRRLLDRGADIEPESLTLTGSTLTWRKGGATKSATLN